MSYLNLNDYNDPIKPYILDALEKRRLLELEMRKATHMAFDSFISPVVSYIAFQKGEFKGIDATLEKLIEKEKEELNVKLGYIIYETLRRGASIALSVSGRLKIDEAIFNSHNKPVATGEARRFSSNTQDVNILIKKTQLDISKKSGELAKHRMEKQRLYREKEFKLSDRVWDLSKGAGEGIKALVEAGVNMDCKKLAKAIDEYTGKGNKKTIKEYPNMMKRLKGRFPPDTTFAAMRVARNELSELYFTTSIKDYLENPYIEAVQWLLADNRLKMYGEKCDCNDIAYEDVYGLGRGIYPIDKVPDRPHVMCLCVLAPITSRKLQKQLEGGMKLGNVPSEEWFEKQKKQLELDLLQDTSKEAAPYSLSKFEWLNKTKENEKALLLEDFSRVNPFFIKKLNSCQKPLIADINYRGTPYYDVKENKIYYNAFIKDPRSMKAGFKTNMTGFLHEAGHYLDYNLSKDGKPIHTKMKDLEYFLKKDALDFINKIYRGKLGKQAVDFKNLSIQELKNGLDFYRELGKLKNIKDLDKLVITELKKNPFNASSVSDLIDGASKSIILAGDNTLYKHSPIYWNADTLKAEATAHFFEVIGSGGNRLKTFGTAFPSLYVYLLNKIR